MPATVERTARGWRVDVHGADVGSALHGALDRVRQSGGGATSVWVRHANEQSDAALAAGGFAPVRDVLQLRRPLPIDEHASIEVRPFVVGQDEEPWLDVNNRAFAWHPEQGAWTRAELDARMAEPWFDAAGFLVHELDGRLAGSCWTKVHADDEPALGEIFVISVDPELHGRGLGRALTVAGLEHLAAKGLTVGMLYVDATNTPAVRLYELLGFDVHHVDRAYEGRV